MSLEVEINCQITGTTRCQQQKQYHGIKEGMLSMLPSLMKFPETPTLHQNTISMFDGNIYKTIYSL